METDKLRYFCALYETKNFTRAAEQCYVSRQALQQAVKSLETQFNMKLIENNRNHISPTPAGTVLYKEAKALLKKEEQMTQTIRALIKTETPIRLGISRSLIPLYAPDVLSKLDSFETEFPGIEIITETVNADEAYKKLKENKYDAILVQDMGTGIVLQDDPACLCTKETFNIIHLKDLENRTIVVPGDPKVFCAPLYKDLKENNIKVRWRTIVDYFEAVVYMRKRNAFVLDRYENGSEKEEGDNYILFENSYSFCCSLMTESNDPAIDILIQYLQITH